MHSNNIVQPNNQGNNHSGVKEIEELAEILAEHRKNGKKIVLCHGCFDLLHIGHIRYMEQARQMGDILAVTITPDQYVDKGPNRPAFSETLRAEGVSSLHCVDYVAINNWPTAEETLRLLKPDIYVKGSDFNGPESDPTGKLAKEEMVVKEINAEIAFTEDMVFSSTNLINRFLSSFPHDTQQYLKLFKSRYSQEDIIGLLDRMASLKVLIVGDTILDDYHYCETLGVSSKDPALALHYESNDLFAGGVLAVANHVANFTDKVRLLTVLGEKDSHENFIRSKLNPKIEPHFAIQDNAPTIIKRRFIEGYSLNKMFEVYIMDDSGLSGIKEEQFCETIRKEIADYDLVLAADFGHGAIGPNTREMLINESPFLAVNTQANAGNRGFHTISRYNSAEYVSISEGEIQLDFRDMEGDIKPMMRETGKRLGCRQLAVTTGKRGCVVLGRDGRMVEVPALVQKVVDRVGSGDAFFSITSLAAFLEAPPELVAFIGNVIGGLAVEILGNQKAISRMNVEKFVTSLLK